MLRIPPLVLVAILISQEPRKFPESIDREVLGRTRQATVLIMIASPGIVSTGSGFLVSPSGHIVTNRHVVESRGPAAPEVTVYLNSGTPEQKKLKAERVFVDPKHDLALIKVEGEGLPALTIGDPAELTETVTLWAFGYPFGILFREGERGPEVTINRGNVTSLRKKDGALEAVQIDTQVNPGNSGGPLISGDGRVYGVITSALAESSLRFAIPSSRVKKLLGPQLRRTTVKPTELPATGGPVTLEADVMEVLTPVEKVTALIEAPGVQKETELRRADEKGPTWSGKWDCPALAEEDRSRIEVTIIMKDKSVKSAVFKSATVTVKTDFGTLAIPASELEDIQYGADGKADRILTSRGTFEGRVEPRTLDAGEKMPLEGIVSARFEKRSGRLFQIRIRVKGGGEEITGPPTPLAVGVPAPVTSPAAGFETRLPENQLEKKLPGTLESAKLAAGGRYLVLHFKALQTLGIFDLERLEFAKYIQLQGEEALFAPGRTKLLICYPDKSRIERWNLQSFEKEITVESPFQAPVTNLEMGWNSDSPAVVRYGTSSERGHTGSIAIFDVDKMRPMEVDLDLQRIGGFQGGTQFRMAAGGTHFTWNRQHSSGITVTRIGEKKLEHKQLNDGWYYGVLSEDGAHLFTGSGLFATEQIQSSSPGNRTEIPPPVLPVVNGPFFLSMQVSPQRQGLADAEVRASLCLLATRQKIITLDFPVLDRWIVPGAGVEGELTRERRAMFFPSAKLFVGIPSTNDRLICRRFNIDELLDQAGVDYLFVASAPPTDAAASREWIYPVQVKSRRGAVQVRMEAGPPGMKVDAKGLLSWLPREAGVHSVILLVSDASGQEVYHSFKITVK